uniref:J domain-containing protein n=4 Tax=Salix TaxID=40685 RepID=A0A6N2M1A9_SALVM
MVGAVKRHRNWEMHGITRSSFTVSSSSSSSTESLEEFLAVFIFSPFITLYKFKKEMSTPFLAGLAIAGAALAGKYGIQAWQSFKARPPKPRLRKFYDGGFQPKMTRREAALILGIRENAGAEKVKEAHRRVMVANHPDAGGSHYLASKINEAKDVMLGKTKDGGSAF